MQLLIAILTFSFFFTSHSLYKSLVGPYVSNIYLSIFLYIIITLIGQSFYLLFDKNVNPYIEYALYIVIFTFSFMFFYYLIIDIIRLFYLKNNPQLLDLKVLIIAILLGIFGFFNRYNIKITKYDLESNKDLKLKIVFLSDLHIGDTGINKVILEKAVKKINKQNPDIVIFGGDIIERNYKAFTTNNINEIIKGIKAQYGVYGVLGNHDYYGGQSTQITKTLQEDGNINILNDRLVNFDKFILIGREDIAKTRFGDRRLDIEEILTESTDKYKIVIDHNPQNFNDSVENNIDLQVSGHTHNGQFFPFTLIVKFFHEKAYGMLKKENSTLIVSSGLSTWRIPIKLGSKPEIVVININ